MLSALKAVIGGHSKETGALSGYRGVIIVATEGVSAGHLQLI